MKSDATLKIEKKLIKSFLKTGTRFALEVRIGRGIVDFITADFKAIHNIPIITCYEIKVSYPDYKSTNGHNMHGDSNYYVMPIELYEEIITKDSGAYGQHPFKENGVYVITKRGALRKILGSSRRYPMIFDSKMDVLGQMLMRWESGTMFRELERHNIKTRNY